MRSKNEGQSRTDLNTTFDEEAFEAFNAIRYQRSQIVLQSHLNIGIPSPIVRTHRVPRNDSAPKSYISPTLTLGCLALGPQIGDCGGRRDRVERHFHDGRTPPGCRSLSPSPKTLPICPPRLVQMNVRTSESKLNDSYRQTTNQHILD